MSRESVHESLNAITLQHPRFSDSTPLDALRFLQGAFLRLEEVVKQELQETTLSDMVQIANRLDSFEELLPQEVTLLRLWLVGGDKGAHATDAVYKQCTKTIRQIMETVKSHAHTPLTTETLGLLQSLAYEGSLLTKTIVAHQEESDRLQRFEQAIKNLHPEDRQFLATILKTKLESACRSRG